jgi:malonyl-CoA O-methyltransferase
MLMIPQSLCSPDTAQSRVERSFRRGLATYHDAAIAQARIAALLVDALQAAGAPLAFGKALEFGCGTGHLTAQILQRFCLDHLILNDLVADCASVLQPILQAHRTQVAFHAGAIETLPLPMGLDLVASASAVQWVQDPAALITRLAAHLAPGGWLAISGYGRGHFAELQGAAAPSYLDPGDWRAILPADLRVHSLTAQPIRLQFADGISLLRHLRQTGVNAGAGTQWTRANLVDFEKRLRAAQPNASDLNLTYCPVTVIAQKAG